MMMWSMVGEGIGRDKCNASVDYLGEETKRVCWDLDLRGGVGEHILHICFLSSSPVHTALAKRLLRHFPRLIDDLYMGDEYYGELQFHSGFSQRFF